MYQVLVINSGAFKQSFPTSNKYLRLEWTFQFSPKLRGEKEGKQISEHEIDFGPGTREFGLAWESILGGFQ